MRIERDPQNPLADNKLLLEDIDNNTIIEHVSEFNGGFEELRKANGEYPYSAIFNEDEWNEIRDRSWQHKD